jgi:hypothetical protein
VEEGHGQVQHLQLVQAELVVAEMHKGVEQYKQEVQDQVDSLTVNLT